MKAKKDKTAFIRVAKDKEKKIKAGLIRVNVWIPAIMRNNIIDIAAKMRIGKKW